MGKVLNKECKVLLQLLAKDLFQSDNIIEWETVSLKELYEEAKKQTVITIAFNALPPEAAKSDPETYEYWRVMSYSIIHYSLENNLANVKLTQLLKSKNIQHCTIKGYASAYYYSNPTLRQMGDIDFLVNGEEFEKAKQILLENGFVEHEHEHNFHIAFKKGKTSYELHKTVTTVPPGKEYVLDVLDDIIDKQISASTACGKVIIPSAFHHGVIMLLHMQRHMVDGGGIGLRHLSDWAVFANSISNENWLEIFEKKLKSVGLWKFAMAISKASSIYLKMPEKEWFADGDTELAEDLINAIFDSGNFGSKARKFQEHVFVDNNNFNSNFISRFFGGITKRVYIWCPFYEKNKFLLPLGYIAYIFRLLFNMLFNNKKINIFKVIKNSNKEYSIYSRLQFFEKE